MKLQALREKLLNQDNKKIVADLLVALEEVSNRWSGAIFTGVRLLGAMFSLVVLVAAIILGTQWFIAYFGMGTFIFTIIVSTFVMSVFITFSSKQKSKE